MYGPPTVAAATAPAMVAPPATTTTSKPSVEYLSSLSPKSLRKVPPAAFPKTKITLEESKLPPYNKLEHYVEPPVKEELNFEDVWMETWNAASGLDDNGLKAWSVGV